MKRKVKVKKKGKTNLLVMRAQDFLSEQHFCTSHSCVSCTHFVVCCIPTGDGHFVVLVGSYYKFPLQTFWYMTFIALGPTFLLSEHLGIKLLQHHIYMVYMYMYMQLYQTDLQRGCVNVYLPAVFAQSLCSASLPMLFILAIQ